MKKQLLITFLILNSLALSAQKTALHFDGVDDYLTVSATSKLNSMTKMTVETWILVTNWYTSPCNNCAPIVWHQGDAYRFGTGNTQKLYFTVMNGSTPVTLTSADTLGGHAWHHIAATFDGTKIRLFVDGIQTDSASYSTFSISYSGTADVWIADPKTGFGGVLEETRIWDYARNVSQIREGMLKHYKGIAPGLVMELSYEDGTPYGNNTGVTTILDNTGYNHDASPDYFAMQDSASNFVIGRSYCDTPVYSSYSITRCTRYTLPSKKKSVTISGVYQDTIVSVGGCDSVMTITVKILKTSSFTYNISGCDSVQDPVSLNYIKKSGKYTTTLKNYQGCDSVVTVNATIYKKDTSYVNADVCAAYQMGSGKIITASGNYVDTFKNRYSCDSFVFYNIKIRNATYASATLTMCKFVICPTNSKKIFRSPGIYYDTILNKNNCDSIIEYTVKSRATSGVVNIRSCGVYQSPSKKYTWSASGTYHDTLFFGNKAGCDSFMTINLTIETATKDSFSVTECGSYRVPSGKTVVTSSGIVTDVIKSSLGCDSIIHKINVTIVEVNTGFTRAGNVLTATTTNTGATFQWMNCQSGFAPISGETNKSFSPPGDGKFALEVKENNCTDTSFCYTFAFNNTDNRSLEQLQVYPNPASGLFYIRSGEVLHDVNITLYSLSGEVINKWHFSEIRQASLKSESAPAVYLLHIQSREGNTNRLLIVE